MVLTGAKWSVTEEGRFCVDARGYEALARDQAEVLRWVGESSWQLDYYAKKN